MGSGACLIEPLNHRCGPGGRSTVAFRFAGARSRVGDRRSAAAYDHVTAAAALRHHSGVSRHRIRSRLHWLSLRLRAADRVQDSERVETSPGRRSVGRRFLVTSADRIAVPLIGAYHQDFRCV